MRINDNELEPYAILADNNKSQFVRCAVCNTADGTVISAGEDGIINVWGPGEATNNMFDADNVKKESHKTNKRSAARFRKPYAK